MSIPLQTLHAATLHILRECQAHNYIPPSHLANLQVIIGAMEKAMGIKSSNYLSRVEASRVQSVERVRALREQALSADTDGLLDALLADRSEGNTDE